MPKLTRTLFLAVIAAILTLVPLNQTVLAQDPPKDKCHDEFDNDHCPRFESFDGRINQFDPMAAVAAYCRNGANIDVWGITDRDGQYLFSLDTNQLSVGLSKAKDQNTRVVLGEKDGRGIVALPTWQLEMYGTAANGQFYTFAFDGNYCGAIAYTGTGGQTAGPSAPALPPTQAAPPANSGSAPAANQFVTTLQGGNITPPAGFTGVQTNTLDFVRFRSAPRIGSATFIGELKAQSPLTAWGRDRRSLWVLVVHEGQVGWLAAQYVNLTPNQVARLPLVIGQ